MIMERLEYTEGYWWRRKSDGFYFRCAYLANWDSADNYELIPDEQHDMEVEDITDKEALEIITGEVQQ